MADDYRKKVHSLEQKIKQLRSVPNSVDLKTKFRRVEAENEVLKDILKSTQRECKEKEREIDRMRKKSPGTSSKDSRSPTRSQPRNASVIMSVREVDERLEDTQLLPKVERRNANSVASNYPSLQSQKFELDNMAEIHRRQDIDRRLLSLKRMKNQSEQRYNNYVDIIKNPQNRQRSVGVTAVLGTTGGSPQKFNTF